MKKSMREIIILMLLISVSGCGTYGAMKRTFSLAPPLNYNIQDLENPEKGSLESIKQDYKDLTIIENIVRGTLNKKGEVVKAGNPSPENIRLLVDSAITSSNNLCRIWFDAMMSKDTKLDSNQGLINIIGDSLLGIAGLAGSSTTGMGIFSIMLGATNAGIENHKGYFRLNGTLPKIYSKLENARKEYKTTLLSASEAYTYKEAQREIRTYHDSCSRRSVENFIEASVELATIKVKSNQKVLDATNKGNLTASSVEVNDLLFGSKKRLSNERLFALYLIDNLDQNDSILSEYLLKNSFNRLLNDTFITLKTGASTTKEKKKVTDLQLEINNVAELLSFEDIYSKILSEQGNISDIKQQLTLAKYTAIYDDAKKDADDLIKQINANAEDSSITVTIATTFNTFNTNNTVISAIPGNKEKANKAIEIFEEWNTLKNRLTQSEVKLKLLLRGKNSTQINGLKVVTQ
ncbi:hypothetical protein A9Q91_01805 [Candidatus Gracilibacteria bacterium 28_42_T64]|nr:hypothetical protein A9Q91_01805 [Candidatus Gracilibacteria bacterium 28_42_T64]